MSETAVHEAGHAVAAAAFGWPIKWITARPGRAMAGLCRYAPPPAPGLITDDRPLALLDADLAAWLLRRAVVTAAGDVAETMMAERAWLAGLARPRRVAEPVAEVAAELLPDLPAPAAGELAEMARVVDDAETESDAARLTRLAVAACHTDERSAQAWLALAGAQAETILSARWALVERLAAELGEAGQLGEAACAVMLDGS